METTEILANVFQKVVAKLDEIDRKLEEKKSANPMNPAWLDIQETCQLLKVSKRTLQAYRDNGILPYSQIGGKIYYRITDIEAHLNRHYKKAFNTK